jgi:glyceraldehyde-3-phosphate dehydrogenase (NAD(P))
MKKLRVAVNGYGVIGKRVADAVKAQQDMELASVADVGTDYRIKTATVWGLTCMQRCLRKFRTCATPASQ